jgi:hypothetical protein
VSAHAQEKVESVPVTESNSGQLGNWMPLDVLDARVKEGPLPTVSFVGFFLEMKRAFVFC